MSWFSVEFRLLQLTLSHIGDERVTVAIVHWDGRELRFAWNLARVPKALGKLGEDVRSALRAIRSEYKSARRASAIETPLHSPALKDVYPVPEGLGSALAWSPVRVGRTRDPKAHFEELTSALSLRGSPLTDEREPEAKRIRISEELIGLGERLQRQAKKPERIKLRNPIHGLRPHESPISWQNGAWHHSFPLSLEQLSPDGVAERFERVLGKIDVSVPQGDVGVILAVYAESGELAEAVAGAERFVAVSFPKRVECLRAPLGSAGQLSLERLEERIKRDIEAAG